MTWLSILSFAGLCLLLSVTPGPDTFLTLRIALSRASAGIATAAGSATAAILWAALVGLGLAAIVEQSAEVFRWIKIAGGVYLLYLGISSFIKARKAAKAGINSTVEAPLPYSRRAGFTAGAVSTMLNPKVGLFYLAVVPQFIPHGGNTLGTALILGLVEAIIAFAYLSLVTLMAVKAMKWLRKPKVSSTMERASSGIITVLGVGVLASAASN